MPATITVTGSKSAVAKTSLAFSVHVRAAGAYQHLEVEIWERPWADSYSYDNAGLRFQWQANTDGSNAGWYAGSLTVEKASLKRLDLAAKVIRRIEKVEVEMYGDPLGVVNILRRMGMFEGVHDSRVSRFLPLEEVLSAEYRAYMAWAEEGQCRNLGQVLARSPEEARPLLVVQVAKNLAGHSGYNESERQKYVQWLANPEALVQGQFGHDLTPDARPAEEKVQGVLTGA